MRKLTVNTLVSFVMAAAISPWVSACGDEDSGGGSAAGGQAGAEGATGGATSSGGSGAGTGGLGGGDATGGAGGGSGGAQSIDLGQRSVVRVEITNPQAEILAACQQDEYRLSGGCDCGDDGNITQSRGDGGGEWICACDVAPAAGTPYAYVICSDVDPEVTQVLEPVLLAGEEVVATCSAGRVVVGGTVNCGDALSNTATSSYPKSPTSWAGECDEVGNEPSVIAYCVEEDVLPGAATLETTILTEQRSSHACEDGTLLVGGCRCPSSSEINATSPSSTEADFEWTCDCNGVPAEEGSVHLLCLP